VLSCIKGFDLFVMSSETEGLGTSLLDAMAAGKPAIGTDVGGIPEAIDDRVSGLVVPPNDPASLARAIVKLLKDDALAKRMGQAGRARARKLFSVDQMVDGTMEAYRRLRIAD
jgi:glycosyltransferase involved in cell wall biosynthesis